MKKLEFKKEINAPAQKVYEKMLGLHNKTDYEYWTKSFNPTSSYEGSWQLNSKIQFVGVDHNGKKAGMVSKVVEHDPAKRVAVQHYGYLDGDKEITTGEQVEKWAGGHEIYNFMENNGRTTLLVELDSSDEFIDYFNQTYPKALDRLKELCEK